MADDRFDIAGPASPYTEQVLYYRKGMYRKDIKLSAIQKVSYLLYFSCVTVFGGQNGKITVSRAYRLIGFFETAKRNI